MSKALNEYYERELVFIRHLAQDFARQYPATANRLLLEPGRSLDPHVERLIEAFALLSGRIHRKLDDEFPELTDALLHVLYPHYLAPIPSMGIVQFDVDPKRVQLPKGFTIERHSRLRTPPLKGLRCTYRTGYPVKLWPIVLTDARLVPAPFPNTLSPPRGARAVFRLQMECQGGLPLSELSVETLRFYLAGERAVVGNLYELLFNDSLQVAFRPLDPDSKASTLKFEPLKVLQPVGFDNDQSLLPTTPQSFPGYRLLSEYFAFPSKFLFFDLAGFDRLRQSGVQHKFEILIYVKRTQPSLEQAVDATTFRLGCTPIVNLFEKSAEPINLSQTKSEYLVLPDVGYPRGLEIYSVETVSSLDPISGRKTDYHPFYSFRHGGDRTTRRAFWTPHRRRSLVAGDRGTDVYLSLVDLDFDPCVPAEATLDVRLLCTNRDLPIDLQQVGDNLPLTLEKAAPINRVRCLLTPTSPLRTPIRRGAYWKLLSHLSLNHLSLALPSAASGAGTDALGALQEMLRLYDYSDPSSGQQLAAINQQLIEGITSLKGRPIVGRVGGPISGGFCRGVEVTLEFDEENYVGSGVYLFASVLEKFYGLYVSINSFSQLIARTKQSEGILKRWPPRIGEQALV